MKRRYGMVGVTYGIFAALLAAGCREKSDRIPTPATATNAPAAKSTMDTFIEGATGKADVDAGRAAQDKIRKISEQHNKDLDEVK